MKKNTVLLPAILLAALAFSSCKKDGTTTPKDYSSLFTNKIWTGEFHYTNKPVQPVSIEFKDGGQLMWNEQASENSGTWKVENSDVTVSFSNGSGFKASIVDDNKLTNFQSSSASAYAMDNLALNNDPFPSLDNTVWNGTNIQMTFKPGNLVDLKIGAGVLYPNLSYTLKAKSFRINPLAAYKWFFVYGGALNMKGANQFSPDPTLYTFQINKQ